MRWEKRGLVYVPPGDSTWAHNSALQPTPLALDEETIRVYVGFRDRAGVSSVGFVDVDAGDPARVIRVSSAPALGPGRPGTFDENGVVPCAVAAHGGQVRLYYAGYQLGQKIRFCVFGGLAVSDDGGETFTRVREVPVFERQEEGLFFRVVHSVVPDDRGWRMWYGAGSEWVERDDGYTLPVYGVRYCESPDGIEIPRSGTPVIDPAGGDEHRIGRPFVIRAGGTYRMFYGMGTISMGYRLGYAESPDGRTWTRKDDEFRLEGPSSGWDETMLAYPAVVETSSGTVLFYNGNDYGRTGFGYAVLAEPW